MLRVWKHLLLPVVFLGLLGLGGRDIAQARPTVIVLSWDGVRHDYPDRTQLPGLEAMEREGLRAGRLRPVFPSNTFPAHVALATGTHPDRHGIVDNRFFDRRRGVYDYGKGEGGSWLEAEPLWAAAERQGVPAATFFWVGSEKPWRGQRTSDVKAPFDEDVSEKEKVDQILAWLDRPEATRPGLIMSWWHGADAISHRLGPDAPGIIDALKSQDAELERLFAGIEERDAWKDVTVIVVSDHGMSAVTEMIDLSDALEDNDIEARIEAGSSVAHIFLDEPADLDRADKALSGVPGVRVFAAADLPSSFRLRRADRTGDLIVVTEAPRTFYRDGLARTYLWWRQFFDSGAALGMHGYDPTHPDMGAIFFARGRGIPVGARPAEVASIDLAPTVATLLGIEPPADSEGKAIAGVGVLGLVSAPPTSSD